MELKYINTEYQQTGNVCVTASYGIVVEYFSKSKFTVNKFLNDYLSKYKVDLKNQSIIAKQGQRKLIGYRENQLSAHFHKICRENGDKRGFEFIKEIHNEDIFNTLQFCSIVSSKAQKEYIEQLEVDLLREALKKGGLAMVLYKVSENSLHSVIVGFDKENQLFFVRDPAQKGVKYEEVLSIHRITEYILFGEE